LERQYYADPNNLHLAQHLIAIYQRLGRGQLPSPRGAIPRKNKWAAVDGVEVSEDEVNDWVVKLFSSLSVDRWAKFPDSDNAEHRTTFTLSGDTLSASAWRYIGTDTWYITFEVAKRTKRYWGQRTFRTKRSK